MSAHSWRCPGIDRPRGAEECQEHSELAIPLEGLFAYDGPRGRSIADLNTAVCIDTAEPYRTSHPLGAGDAGISIVLEPETLADLLETRDLRHYESRGVSFPNLALHVSARSHVLLSLLCRRLTRRSSIEPIVLEETLLRLVLALWRDRSGASDGGRSHRSADDRRARIDHAKQILAGEFKRALLIHEVASRVALSPQHFCRVFKLETGMPVHRYLNRLRLRAATAAMATPDCDFSRIALDAGFSSHSHFSQAFRREFGMTPSSFRELATRPKRADPDSAAR